MKTQSRWTATLALLLLTATGPSAFGAATPLGQLHRPRGPASPTGEGDFISPATAPGLNTPYYYFAEVPPNLSRLVVDIFDADICLGGNGSTCPEFPGVRDELRPSQASSHYRVFDPNGNEQPPRFVVGDNTQPAGSDDAWLALFDSNSPFFVAQTVQVASSDVTSITLATPAGVQTGDLLLAVISTDGASDVTPQIPANWTLILEQVCAGNACRLEIYRRVVASSEPASHQFNIAAAQQGVASLIAYRGVDTVTPVAGSGATSGTSAAPTAPDVTISPAVSNPLVVRAYAADGSGVPSRYVANHAVRYSQQSSSTRGAARGGASDRTLTTAGSTGTAAFSLPASEQWAAATVVLRASASRPAPPNGHWTIRVNMSANASLDPPDNNLSTGRSINAFGLRVHDGDPTSAGTEIPVYFDSHAELMVPASTNLTLTYSWFPWVTSGCVFSEADFDYDNTAICGANPCQIQVLRPDSFSLGSPPPPYPSPSTLHQTIPVTSLSGNNVWVRNGISSWTNDFNAVHYGIWQSDATISHSSAGNAAHVYYVNFEVSGTAQPSSNPTANAFRVYLPTDAGAPPAKPYLEQLLRWDGVGPSTPTVGQTTRMTVTVRLVNPTTGTIQFSQPSNVVTVPLSGDAQLAYVGVSASASTGSVVSQPSGGASSGSVVWDPGTVAAGAVELLEFQVDVTPTATARIPVTEPPDISPTLAGTRGQWVDETGNASQARATYLFGPLCELAVTPNSPTRAAVGNVQAVVAAGGGVWVEWETTPEDLTAGFEVWRRTADEWEHVGTLRTDARTWVGAHYRVWDRGAPSSEWLLYRLVEIERSGTRRNWGPFAVEVETAADGERREERQPLLPSPQELERLRLGSARDRGELFTLQGEPGVRGPGAVRLELDREGLYRVGVAELAAAWRTPVDRVSGWLQRRQIRLERLGEEVSILPEADWSGFYFYAPEEKSPYTQRRTYWVRYAPGRWIENRPAREAAVRTTTASWEWIEAEQDIWDVPALPLETGADFWFWEVLIGADADNREKVFEVDTPGAEGASKGGQLLVRLQGANAGEHEVAVFWNDASLGVARWKGLAAHEASFRLPGGQPNAEKALVRLRVENPRSEIFVDSFRVDYQRRHEAVGGQLVLHPAGAATQGAVVGGLKIADVEVWEVTAARRPQRLHGWRLHETAGGYLASFRAPGWQFLVAERSAAFPPLSLSWSETPALRTMPGAEYVVIAPDVLLDGAAALAARREQEGLSVALVRLQNIYDEFAFGEPDPEAIREFLRWGWERWNVKPRFVVLVGEGTYDWRNLLGLGGNLIPARLVGTAFGLVSADAGFGDVNGDGLAEIAVGRIPVLAAEEMARYLEKLAAYEEGRGPWTRRVQVVADDGPERFEGAAAQLAARLPAHLETEVRGIGPDGFAATRKRLLGGLESGLAWVAYVGHGGMDRLASEGLLTSADAPNLQNTPGSWLAALTCVINRHEVPRYSALGEELVRHAKGGVVAVWAPSGVSDHGQAVLLGQELAGVLYRQPQRRLGDVLLEASRRYVMAGGHQELLAPYQLLGDPALRLPEAELPELPPEPPEDGNGS